MFPTMMASAHFLTGQCAIAVGVEARELARPRRVQFRARHRAVAVGIVAHHVTTMRAGLRYRRAGGSQQCRSASGENQVSLHSNFS
jgi:hypothetical protein